MAGRHRLQHVVNLGAPNLADDNAIGPHSQAVLDQVALRYLALALKVHRPGFEPDDVRLLQ